MFCPKCGAKSNDGVKFCANCGANIASFGNAPATVGNGVAAVNNVAAAAPDPEKKFNFSKSKSFFIILNGDVHTDISFSTEKMIVDQYNDFMKIKFGRAHYEIAPSEMIELLLVKSNQWITAAILLVIGAIGVMAGGNLYCWLAAVFGIALFFIKKKEIRLYYRGGYLKIHEDALDVDELVSYLRTLNPNLKVILTE